MNCIISLESDIYFSLATELSGRQRGKQVAKIFVAVGSIVAAIPKEKYGASHNLSRWHPI